MRNPSNLQFEQIEERRHILQQVKSFGLNVRLPAQVRARSWKKAGICDACLLFREQTAPEKLAAKKLPGIKREKVRTRRLCRSCMTLKDKVELILPDRNRAISPSLATQLLVSGCPYAHFLRGERRKTGKKIPPPSREHALGLAYHEALRRLWEINFSSEESLFFRHRRASIRALSREIFSDPKIFPRGVGFRENWEKSLLGDILSRMLHHLHHQKVPLSRNEAAEKFRQQGVKLVWSEAELRVPPTDLAWILGGYGIEAPEMFFSATLDRICLLEDDHGYRLIITDHKIPDVDFEPGLKGADYKTQVALYALWALKAFADLKIGAERISFEIGVLNLSPLRFEKIEFPFNREGEIWAAKKLTEAVNLLGQYQHQGFPARPGRVCQNCDFAFSGCSFSKADPARWKLAVPHEPLIYPPQRPVPVTSVPANQAVQVKLF